jgi:hypothetical protein
MTALNEYQRLEATALWRPDPEAQRRDVFVSLGDATLVIHDGKDMALSHWSLPAITRLNPGAYPARYAPGEDAPEELEVADTTMIDVIERVRSAVERGRPHPGRLRSGITLALVLLVSGVLIFWVPGALVRQTASIVPDATRTQIGAGMMAEIRPLVGPICMTPQGQRALVTLARRLLPDTPPTLIVVPSAIRTTRHLPDGTVLVGRALVEDHDTPEVVAGYVLAETARMNATDPLEAMLEVAGVRTAVRLLTTGDVPGAAIRDAARRIVAAEDPPPPTADALIPLFADAGVRLAPYAYAVDPTGETTLALIEADPAVASGARPLLGDDTWVALQNICGP